MAFIWGFAKEYGSWVWSKMMAADETNSHAIHRTAHGPNLPPRSSGISEGITEIQSDDDSDRGEKGVTEAETEGKPAGDVPRSVPNATPVKDPRLKLGPRQIRVLSIETAPENENSTNGPIRCTLETVDLDDWTPFYRQFSQVFELWKSLFLKFFDWRMISIAYRCKVRDGHTGLATMPIKDLWKLIVNEIYLLSKAKFNVSAMEDIHVLEPRWNWGDYIALSYVWGDSNDREKILVDGHEVSVTKSLFHALQRLSRSFEIRERHFKVWVDAVCINQDDLEERAREVQKMHMIYSGALAVRAWVGLPPPASDTMAFSTARTWLDEVREINPFETTVSLVPNLEVARSLGTLAYAILFQTYWSRVWIVQEVSLASSLLFWYGDWSFTETDLMRLIHLFHHSGLLLTYPDIFGSAISDKVFQLEANRIFARLSHLRLSNKFLDISDTLNLKGILDLAKSAKATDPRDNVYGLLALLPKAVSAEIHPNYSAGFDVWDAYTSFSKACFVGEGNLNILARVRMYHSDGHNLPSWAFDLSSNNQSLSSTTHAHNTKHDANKNWDKQATLTFSDDNRIMFCEGVFVDSIMTLGASRQLKDGQNLWLPTEPEVEPSTVDTGPYLVPVNETSKLALARVLCHDSNYKFSDGPSLLDVPWIQERQLAPAEYQKIIFATINQDMHRNNEARRWSTFIATTTLYFVFRLLLYANAAFPIHGVALRHYFDSTEEYCPDIETYIEIGYKAFEITYDTRLCTTKEGLIGTAPKDARLGDKIAVLAGCDMPALLRPKGEHYEYIGACFIEGLMKGEAVASVARGDVSAEIISIC
ncbi:heterokaryon incompatibility protein-domain-containing protein [Hypoxylon cercidicola]|nr:heterokaryon incompatibility protein-domain-containing protein [Hypoxylon cercidicola]